MTKRQTPLNQVNFNVHIKVILFKVFILIKFYWFIGSWIVARWILFWYGWINFYENPFAWFFVGLFFFFFFFFFYVGCSTGSNGKWRRIPGTWFGNWYCMLLLSWRMSGYFADLERSYRYTSCQEGKCMSEGFSYEEGMLCCWRVLNLALKFIFTLFRRVIFGGVGGEDWKTCWFIQHSKGVKKEFVACDMNRR